MGTRSLTFIKEKTDKEYSINMYKQYDGYPSGYGLDLAEYLNKFTIVNGFSMSDERKIANGVSCLIAQLVSNFKQDVGGIYIYPTKDTDCGQDYEYHISVDDDSGEIEIEVKESGYVIDDKYIDEAKTIFKGSPTEFIKKYS